MLDSWPRGGGQSGTNRSAFSSERGVPPNTALHPTAADLTLARPRVSAIVSLPQNGGLVTKTFPVVFGAAIAFILLILYASTVRYMVKEVVRSGQVDSAVAIDFPSGLVFVVTTIGGLVSALVIAKLTITEPGKNPGIMRLAARDGGTQSAWVTWLALAYLAIWLIVGLAALVAGVMLYPKVNQTLNDIGTTWLGLAVASGYAYFGITPNDHTVQANTSLQPTADKRGG